MMKDEDKLTTQQKVFVSEYIIDRNGRQAAIRAGYSEKTAENQASRLLSYDKVRDVIDQQLKLRERRTLITSDFVLEGIKSIAVGAEKESDRLRAYELLGKNLKMFTDRQEIAGENGPLELAITIDYGTEA